MSVSSRVEVTDLRNNHRIDRHHSHILWLAKSHQVKHAWRRRGHRYEDRLCTTGAKQTLMDTLRVKSCRGKGSDIYVCVLGGGLFHEDSGGHVPQLYFLA